ncbi:geranylgeranyl transferase type-2 subunit alpha [Histomonas meleagridis]|uniref:geranylgeranyl transferase type-2 subunit alpha n=1 Tax=Histomonas meleagridis TaxID=135588 RepID=UPI00355980C6|nr:geranylgeranyl transferase type-2 subunit alpha [Histomonas meleagridis]KAH0803145.1 geranylgeranyl transferase type-2 subunit alpha [Histomonas meleagridis]
MFAQKSDSKMHGRKKVSIDEAERIKDQKKAKMLKEMIAEANEAIKDPTKFEEFLPKSAQLLVYLDDFATLWNMRKKRVLENKTEENLTKELQVALQVLRKNPKAYWAWHHRRWCADLCENFDYKYEVELCNQYLAADCRNFHVWRHRRWAVSRCGEDIYTQELAFSSKLIAANFSNFSAWHYRSQLPNLTNFEEEIETAKAAFWTDPNDQSSWIYYRWLLTRPSIKENVELLQEEVSGMDELMHDEPKCKYPYLAGIWLQRALPNPDEKKISELKEKLKQIDPIRAPYYDEQ